MCTLSNAFVLATCDKSQEDNVIERLEKIDSIEYVQRTIGAYNLVIKLNEQNNNRLQDIIMNEIKEIKDINYSLSLMEMPRI